ncbi:hypothetical protein HQ576_03935, partial [bacterium]|nr:hypothetical protein [bacterium]
RIHTQAKDTKPPFDTRGITDPRYASIVQKELLYYLMRMGVPTTVYYLESVRKEDLARHKALVVPFPLAISKERAELIHALCQSGKPVLICGTDGPLDEGGTPHKRPVLVGLVRGGEASFIPPEVLDRLAENRENEKRTRKERVFPPPINSVAADSILSTITRLSKSPSVGPLMAGRVPEGDDMELCLSVNRRGEKLFLAINWDAKERSVTLPKRPCFDPPAAEAYLLGPDGKWAPWKGSFRPKLTLQAQQALVARLARGTRAGASR